MIIQTSMTWLMVVLATVALSSSAQVATVTKISMDGDDNKCGETVDVQIGSEAIVTAGGDVTDTECQIRFEGHAKDNCEGICVNVKDSSFKECSVSLLVQSGIEEEEYNCAKLPEEPWCSQETFLDLKVKEDAAYVPNPDSPGYSFTATVYNKCGYNTVPNSNEGNKGGKGSTFEEAAKHLDGYHHGEEFDDKIHGNFVNGILLGFGLSFIFLIVLLMTFCYYHHSPNRGASRSVGLPKVGFTKKLRIGGDNKKKTEDPEAQFRYTHEPLLEGGQAAEDKDAKEEGESPEAKSPVAINIEPAEESPKRKGSNASKKSDGSGGIADGPVTEGCGTGSGKAGGEADCNKTGGGDCGVGGGDSGDAGGGGGGGDSGSGGGGGGDSGGGGGGGDSGGGGDGGSGGGDD